MYIYCADLYCDPCGGEIRERLTAAGVEDSGDSGDFPQPAGAGETDCPSHCAGEGPAGLEGADSGPTETNPSQAIAHCAGRELVAGPDGTILGYVGELLPEGLTSEGVRYVQDARREALEEGDPWRIGVTGLWIREWPDAAIPILHRSKYGTYHADPNTPGPDWGVNDTRGYIDGGPSCDGEGCANPCDCDPCKDCGEVHGSEQLGTEDCAACEEYDCVGLSFVYCCDGGSYCSDCFDKLPDRPAIVACDCD